MSRARNRLKKTQNKSTNQTKKQQKQTKQKTPKPNKPPKQQWSWTGVKRSKTLAYPTKRLKGMSANLSLEAEILHCQPALNPFPASHGSIQTSKLKAYLCKPVWASINEDFIANMPPQTWDPSTQAAGRQVSLPARTSCFALHQVAAQCYWPNIGQY